MYYKGYCCFCTTQPLSWGLIYHPCSDRIQWSGYRLEEIEKPINLSFMEDYLESLHFAINDVNMHLGFLKMLQVSATIPPEQAD